MKLQLPLSSDPQPELPEPKLDGTIQDVLDRIKSIQHDTDARAEKWLDRLDRYTAQMR